MTGIVNEYNISFFRYFDQVSDLLNDLFPGCFLVQKCPDIYFRELIAGNDKIFHGSRIINATSQVSPDTTGRVNRYIISRLININSYDQSTRGFCKRIKGGADK